jgi:hypothetical protein
MQILIVSQGRFHLKVRIDGLLFHLRIRKLNNHRIGPNPDPCLN